MLVLLVACNARLGSPSIDDDTRLDAGDNGSGSGSDSAVPDGPMPDGMTYAASCMTAGYTTTTATTSLYRVAAANKEWLDAEAECAADVPGATHLVVLSSQAEVDYVQSTRRGWVGLSDRQTEGTFVNVTAEPNDVRPFASGQPDNGGGDENCVQLKADGLDDDQCNNKHAFLCECDGRPAQ